jgi:hypothetical protein
MTCPLCGGAYVFSYLNDLECKYMLGLGPDLYFSNIDGPVENKLGLVESFFDLIIEKSKAKIR